MIAYPIISLISKPLAALFLLPYCGVGIATLVWYIWGMFLKWGAEGQGCFSNGLLTGANTLTSWYYGITLTLIGLLCCLASCFIAFAVMNAKEPSNDFR